MPWNWGPGQRCLEYGDAARTVVLEGWLQRVSQVLPVVARKQCKELSQRADMLLDQLELHVGSPLGAAAWCASPCANRYRY